MNPTKTSSWKKLEHFASNKIDCSKNDFTVQLEGIHFNYSRQLIDNVILQELLNFAEEQNLPEEIEKMFSGQKINQTENRAVLHTALRDLSSTELLLNGEDILPLIRKELTKVKSLSERIISGEWKGFSGKKITDIVNIGIGGSDLGPRMVVDALKSFHNHLKVHFVSNVDSNDLKFTLDKLNPKTTLFIIASKTFTTIETMTNAKTAKSWLLDNLVEESAVKHHFVAVSTNKEAVSEFGIDTQNMLEFWDWVGGRYSLWSSIGLSIAFAIGFENFEQLLKGAHSADKHFRNTPFDKNIPVLMALLGVWNRNFLKAESVATIPYNELLYFFTPYLQQLDMESNGKKTDKLGNKVTYETGPIIWGGVGSNVQHSFFQHIHQGTELIPIDFIGFVKNDFERKEHQNILLANLLAQSKALFEGNIDDDSYGKTNDSAKPWRSFEGRIPSNIFLIDELNPYNLGLLTALYEHKVFVQGVLWNIFSFDQWGVELGKKIAKDIEKALKDKNTPVDDVSKKLIAVIKQFEGN